MFWIGNGNRTELNVMIVVHRTRMAQTEISILYWYWHTIMQTHSGVLTVTRRWALVPCPLMICGHRVRVCWRYFHWLWFKSSQNLRISLWSPLAITKTTRSVSIRYVFRHHSHIPRIITHDITLTYLNSPLLPQIALSTPLMTAWVTDHHMMQ